MTNIAVTGGTGCLGRPLIEKLTNFGFKTHLLTLPQDPAIDKLRKEVNIIKGNLSSSKSLNQLTKNCDIVFHIAGKVHSNIRTQAEKDEFFRVNLEGTRNLLAAAKHNKVKRIVFYSTVGVYGKDADFHGDELCQCQPDSVYSESKYLAEQLVLNGLKDGGPEGTVLRFPVVYGPLDRGNMAALIKAVRKKQFFYFGDGNCLRSVISSRNTADAAFKAAFEPKATNEVFCVTDGRDWTMNELIESILGALDTSWRPYHVPVFLAKVMGKLGDLANKWPYVSFPIDSGIVRKLSRPLTFSCEKSKKMLGYEPVETLDMGIRKEVEWLYPELKSTDSADYTG